MPKSHVSDQVSPWRNRIVGHGESAPDQLLANEANWRIHPYSQQQALAGVLSDVGYVQSVVVNKRTSELWPVGKRGVETMVDGHMRAEIAISKGQPTIPVVYVDLDPAEEAEVLASFDPISALAMADAEKLDALLREVQTGDEALATMLTDLAEDNGIVPGESTETVLKQLDTKPPPKMTWVLIGIPTVRFGEIAADAERLAKIEGIILETTSNDG